MDSAGSPSSVHTRARVSENISRRVSLHQERESFLTTVMLVSNGSGVDQR